jgi:hypothetical protein
MLLALLLCLFWLFWFFDRFGKSGSEGTLLLESVWKENLGGFAIGAFGKGFVVAKS